MGIMKKVNKAKQKQLTIWSQHLSCHITAALKNEKFLNGDKRDKGNDSLESILGFVLKGPRIKTQFMLFPMSKDTHRIEGIMVSKCYREAEESGQEGTR